MSRLKNFTHICVCLYIYMYKNRIHTHTRYLEKNDNYPGLSLSATQLPEDKGASNNQLYLLRYEKDRNHTTHLFSCERIFEGVFQLNERRITSNFKNGEGV